MKIISDTNNTRKTISLFLSFIITATTLTALLTSSSLPLTDVYAVKDVEKDKIDCNNVNVNLNGVSIDAIPKPLSSLLQAQAERGGAGISTSNGDNRFGYDKDFLYKCINNNDNEFILSSTSLSPILPEPPVSINNVCTVWEDVTTSDNRDIFFSGSDDDGETFSIPQNISKNPEDSLTSQIKCDGNNVYVVWVSFNSNNFEIFFSYSHDGGQTFSQPDNLSNNTGLSSNPQISSEGNNVYVVWRDDTDNTPDIGDIFFVRSIDGGDTFSDPNNISGITGGSSDVQISSEGNNVYVVWEEITDILAGNLDILFARSTDGGDTFSDPNNISDNAGSSLFPHISSEGNNVYVVWTESNAGNRDIFFVRSTNGGVTFSDPDNISENVRSSGNPQISSEGNNVYVVWQNLTTNLADDDIFFVRSTNGGVTFSDPDNISENVRNSRNPQISSDGNNVYVVWVKFTLSNSPDNIFFSYSHDGGQTFSDLNNLSNITGFLRNQQISISSEGNNVYLIWEDLTDILAGNQDIFFVRSTDGGQTFNTPPDNLSNSTGNSRSPQISSTTEIQQQSTNNIFTTSGNNNDDHIINNLTTKGVTTINSIIKQAEE